MNTPIERCSKEISPASPGTDPWSFGTVAIGFAAGWIDRAYLPAHTAMQLNPVEKPPPPRSPMKRTLLTLILSVAMLPLASAQSPEDTAAIRQTALDYIEGWYEGNAERMQRALHPDLAKRIVTQKNTVNSMTAQRLIEQTRNGGGKDTPPEKQQKDVTILDVFGKAASVKVVASDWIDYMQMGKVDGRWVIINVLWETKPKAG